MNTAIPMDFTFYSTPSIRVILHIVFSVPVRTIITRWCEKYIKWGWKVIWGHFNPKILPFAVMFFARISFFSQADFKITTLNPPLLFLFQPCRHPTQKLKILPLSETFFTENISKMAQFSTKNLAYFPFLIGIILFVLAYAILN